MSDKQTEPMVMVPASVIAELKTTLRSLADCWVSDVCDEGPNEAALHLAAIEERTITDPAAMAAELGKIMGQGPEAWALECQTMGGDTGWKPSWSRSDAGVCHRLSGESSERALYRIPQPAPDYAVAIERAAEVCEVTCAKEDQSARDYDNCDMPNLARDHRIRADESGYAAASIRALMPAGVEVMTCDGIFTSNDAPKYIQEATQAGKRVYIVTVTP